MATSYNRYINLFIDGKQVESSVKGINAALSKIRNEQRLMTIGSQEYIAAATKIKSLKGMLDEHNKAISNVSKSWTIQGIADGFNKYFALVTAGIASLTGVAMGFKAIVKTFNDFEERVDNLSALTGLAGESLDWLTQKAKDMSTATLEGGIRITQSAQEIIDAFTKTGSARPELLKNKEALVAVTENAIILANASKTELQPAIEALTGVMNQYNVPASEARRIINALAAGSKEGAGEVPYLTMAFEKAGTVASDAGISIETLVATIETLAPRISQPEIAGRSLKGVLLDLQTGADDTNPALVGLSTALENLGKKNFTVTELTKKFGVENITTAKILIDNVEELKKYEKAVSGTNVAIEQATINTDNNNSKLAQAKNRINIISIELGERLSPALSAVTGWFGKLLTGLLAMINFFIKYKAEIITATAAIAGYTIAVKISAMMTERQNRSSVIALAIQKVKVFWHHTERAALMLLTAAQALLTGNIARATQAMRIFNLTAKLSPIGLLIGLLTAVGTALYFYTKKLTDAQVAQKQLDDINLEARKSIVEEKIKLESLIDVAKNKSLSDADRLEAIRHLNAISPEHLGFLTLENIGTDKATLAVKGYTGALYENARIQAAQQKLVELEKKRLDDVASGADRKITFMQRLGVQLVSNGNYFKSTRLLEQQATENATKSNETYLASIARVKEIINPAKTTATVDSSPKDKTNVAVKDLIKDQEDLLEVAKKMPRATREDIIARNKKIESIEKEISALNNLGKTTKESKGENTLTDTLGIAHKQRLLDLTARYANEESMQKEFHARMLAEELAYLQAQLAMETDQGKKIDLQTEIINKTKSYTDALKEATPEIMKNSAERLNMKAGLEDEVKLLAVTARSLKKAGIEYDDMAAKIAAQVDLIQGMTGVVADGLYEMISGTEDAFQSFAKNLLIFALEQLKVQAQIAYAAIFIQYLAKPDSLATLGASAVIKSAIMYGLIESVFAVAEGAVNGAFSGGKKGKSGYATGGYTGDGGTLEPAGIVHKGEYVIPQWMVRNPAMQPLIGMTEFMRRNSGFGRLELNPLAMAGVGASAGYAGGGYAAPQAGSQYGNTAGGGDVTSQKLLVAIDGLNRHIANGITARVAGYGGEGSVADAIQKIAALAKSLKL